ncbi:MAG TPA: sulfurtransferase TusA family protein [Actinomycetota bacterium]|nr:sulfurtransferase TusA family protein [Actinomycetota bacterium]
MESTLTAGTEVTTIAETPDATDGPSDAVRRLLGAIAAQDYKATFAALAPGVRFRYLIPSGPSEVHGAADASAKFHQWFGDADEVTVEALHIEPVSDRMSARYRFLVRTEELWEVIEQHAFIDVDQDLRIETIDLVCSGFRPSPQAGTDSTSTTHRFDAGDLGCADGLAQEFRRRILAIPVGDALAVQTTDPAAKEDLPPLARMMGHQIRSIETPGNGRLLITVERRR